jgi:hypothetical protein
MLRGLLISIACLILFQGNIFAQSSFKGGLALGLSASQVHGDTYSGFDKAGIYGGGFVRRDLNEKWAAQLELTFIQKGSRKNPDAANGDYVLFLLKLDYIEMPLLLQWNYKQLSFETGLSYAALIHNYEANQFGPVTNIVPLQKSDICFLAGMNFKINDHFKVNLRNSNSIFPVRKFDAPVYYQRRISNWFNKGMYNNVMILALQYQF